MVFCRRIFLHRAVAFVSSAMLFSVMSACHREPRSGVRRSPVMVTIRFKGSPLKIGVVDILNKESGEGASATLDEFGMVSLTGIAHGEYAVTIQPPPSLAADGSEIQKTGKFPVDSNYRSSEKTPLAIVVDDKNQSFELNVE